VLVQVCLDFDLAVTMVAAGHVRSGMNAVHAASRRETIRDGQMARGRWSAIYGDVALHNAFRLSRWPTR